MKNNVIVNTLKTAGLVILNVALAFFAIPLVTVAMIGLAHAWKWTTMYLIGLLPF
jgi:hypothetical protein